MGLGREIKVQQAGHEVQILGGEKCHEQMQGIIIHVSRDTWARLAPIRKDRCVLGLFLSLPSGEDILPFSLDVFLSPSEMPYQRGKRPYHNFPDSLEAEQTVLERE